MIGKTLLKVTKNFRRSLFLSIAQTINKKDVNVLVFLVFYAKPFCILFLCRSNHGIVLVFGFATSEKEKKLVALIDTQHVKKVWSVRLWIFFVWSLEIQFGVVRCFPLPPVSNFLSLEPCNFFDAEITRPWWLVGVQLTRYKVLSRSLVHLIYVATICTGK